MIEVAQDEGDPIPQAVIDAPVPFTGAQKYLDAFWILSAGRTYNATGCNPIAISEFLAYFQIFGIDDIDEREDTIDFIRAMDAVYLKHQADNRPQQ